MKRRRELIPPKPEKPTIIRRPGHKVLPENVSTEEAAFGKKPASQSGPAGSSSY